MMHLDPQEMIRVKPHFNTQCPYPPGFPDLPTALGVGRRLQLLLNAQLMPAMNADYRPTLGSFFCVFQPRMVALLSVPATQGLLKKWT